MNTETKLPFKAGDSFEYPSANKNIFTKSTMSILAVSEDTGVVFVNANGHGMELRITDVLTRINDGRFTVKVAS